ncbi:nucleotide disphospho-sugar-binding domain-containing protein [Bradyrhizobium lablabi]|uniref:glycosyltransferase n=1 Tax=Bradyrhizobium lablabi TaxID=722472 RepID=UPI00289EE8E7|nr:nucleotide disphospho-sugar-binding domain-containing protein [Bradyrhizobium lablabi]
MSTIGRNDQMKILFVSTPGTGHLDPLLAIGRILNSEGHELACLTGTFLRNRVEQFGAKFYPLPEEADLTARDVITSDAMKGVPPGPQWLRTLVERFFVDTIPAQYSGVQNVLREFPAEIIIGDDMFFGVLPMLVEPRSNRLPIVLCGTSILHWQRKDKAPTFAGLPPAATQAQLDEYAAFAREHDKIVDGPLGLCVNRYLKDLGVGPVSKPLFESVVELADAYMQLTVPRFEFPRDIPSSVTFIGVPPIIPNQVPLPAWAHELDGSRKVVLVTQGTVANHDLNLLIAPALAGLANEPDLLVVITAGGRAIDDIPGPIPDNARLASYLPFEWLLPKVDVLVTNGGYGSVNQAMSFGIPLVTAGLTEDKADVNVRVAWSGVGINLATNNPTPQTLREAVRVVLDKPDYRLAASAMADEFKAIDTRSEILRIINQVRQGSNGPWWHNGRQARPTYRRQSII